MKITTTKYCDRWDLLAYDLFGDASLAPALMAANAHLITLHENHIPEGVEIVIPEGVTLKTNVLTSLAPWKI